MNSPLVSAAELQGLPNAAKQYVKELIVQSHAPEPQWEEIIQSKRERALLRKTLILAVEGIMTKQGKSMSASVNILIASINNGDADSNILQAAHALAQKSAGNKCPDRARLIDWFNRYIALGIMGLVDAHKGRQREFYGWEVEALHYWLKPTRPKAAIIAGWLQDKGWDSAKKHRVQSFFKGLPEQLNKEAPQRQGLHHYHQNHKPYVIRDNTVLPVGLIYTGDGHTCDVYIQHPVTGNPWRAEFTPWLDLRSHYPVGWYLSESESAITTLFSLSQAVVQHDHVPAAIYVDPGSGFKNRMMNDKTTGYFARLGIEPLLALPGNARGKGLVEGFFNHFEEYVGKKFPTYCGHCRTDDELRTMKARIKRGELKLPSMLEYWDAINQYMERYKVTVQKNLGCAPADLWADLERTELGIPAEAIVRPAMERTVQNWRVQLFSRKYQGDALKNYESKRVIVQYNLHDLTEVAVFDMQHRFICDASIVNPIPAQTQSRIEELKQQSTDKKVERLMRHVQEKQDRAKPIITADDSTNALIDLTDDDYSRLEVANTDSDPLDYLYLPTETKKGADENSSFLDWLDD